jgi:hypothetical protein
VAVLQKEPTLPLDFRLAQGRIFSVTWQFHPAFAGRVRRAMHPARPYALSNDLRFSENMTTLRQAAKRRFPWRRLVKRPTPLHHPITFHIIQFLQIIQPEERP